MKTLVEMHQGTVQVESQLGRGSRFTIRLLLGRDHVNWNHLDAPVLSEEPDARVQLSLKSFDELDLTPFSQERPDCPHLLLVEDHPQIVQILGYLLQNEYNLHFARDGQEGLEKIAELQPDLVISDIMMPRKNGYELVRAVRSTPELKATPIILLTSKADEASRIEGFEEGADEYLTKPFNHREVLVRVRGLIERRRLEAEFVHLEKMVSVGRLAAGVAHEINNPLAYAHSAAETLDQVFKAIQTGKIPLAQGIVMAGEAIQRMKEGTERVIEITEALRTFVRQGNTGFDVQDIHPGIEATIKLLSANHKPSVRFQRRYELKEKTPCHVNQLNQVVMNLLQNALDAVGNQPEAAIWIRTYREGDHAGILIEDNGPGIPKPDLKRIFDPFFTTKKLGKGTGLGLYISREIIQEHGGALTVNNRHPESGVRCLIQLPLTQKEIHHAQRRFTHPAIDRSVENVRYPDCR